jgi:hypothetical protein
LDNGESMNEFEIQSLYIMYNSYHFEPINVDNQSFMDISNLNYYTNPQIKPNYGI